VKNRIITLLVCVVGTLPMLACKEDAPTYSENNLSQNQIYATQAAKMASENALKTAPPPKLESSQGVEASFPLPVPTDTKAAP
jgi:hypothetical protein